MINYLAELYVKALILLSCVGWAALAFWGLLWTTEKILRFVYQDTQQFPPPIQEQPPAECRDCALILALDDAERCDLCAAIERAVIEKYGFGSVPVWAES